MYTTLYLPRKYMYVAWRNICIAAWRFFTRGRRPYFPISLVYTYQQEVSRVIILSWHKSKSFIHLSPLCLALFLAPSLSKTFSLWLLFSVIFYRPYKKSYFLLCIYRSFLIGNKSHKSEYWNFYAQSIQVTARKE